MQQSDFPVSKPIQSLHMTYNGIDTNNFSLIHINDFYKIYHLCGATDPSASGGV